MQFLKYSKRFYPHDEYDEKIMCHIQLVTRYEPRNTTFLFSLKN